MTYRPLTDDEKKALDALGEKWLANGLSTEPCDRAAAEAGVRAAYTAAGMKEPRFILWTESPWGAVIMQALLPAALSRIAADREMKERGNEHTARLKLIKSDAPASEGVALRTTLDAAIDPVATMINSSMSDARNIDWAPSQSILSQLLGNARSSLLDQLSAMGRSAMFDIGDLRASATEATLDASVASDGALSNLADAGAEFGKIIGEYNEHAEQGGDVESNIVTRVASPVVSGSLRNDEIQMLEAHVNSLAQRIQRKDKDGEQLRKRLEDWWRGRIWGQFNSGYYCWIDALRVLGFDTEPITGQIEVALNAGYWWAFAEYAILTERPSTIRRDQQGRLHNAEGPAIGYRDGWGVYVWHGTRVPFWVVESPTIEQITGERNVEIRRCGIESYGWERFITDAQLKLVNECDDPGNPGRKLGLYDVPESLWGARVRVLLCTNGSPRADGEYPRFGLPVPVEQETALSAAAWGYNMEPERYAKLQRRS
jgi:hypothetical protein